MAATTMRTAEPGGSEQEQIPTRQSRRFCAVANVFKLLSDETRLRSSSTWYRAANSTSPSVRAVRPEPARRQPPPARLRVSGLIEPRRDGKNNFYSVRAEASGRLRLHRSSANGELGR